MHTFDKVVELKALQSEHNVDKNIEILQYALLVVMDKGVYINGNLPTRLNMLGEAFRKIKELVK